MFSHNLFNLTYTELLFFSTRGSLSVCSFFPVQLNLRKLRTTVGIVLNAFDVQAYFSLNGQIVLLILLDETEKINLEGTAQGVQAIPSVKLLHRSFHKSPLTRCKTNQLFCSFCCSWQVAPEPSVCLMVRNRLPGQMYSGTVTFVLLLCYHRPLADIAIPLPSLVSAPWRSNPTSQP